MDIPTRIRPIRAGIQEMLHRFYLQICYRTAFFPLFPRVCDFTDKERRLWRRHFEVRLWRYSDINAKKILPKSTADLRWVDVELYMGMSPWRNSSGPTERCCRSGENLGNSFNRGVGVLITAINRDAGLFDQETSGAMLVFCPPGTLRKWIGILSTYIMYIINLQA